ncbi:uncharacterized protein K452DRAFT_300598 [Aplosporella prunicola CBS 121167]|uniref:DNA polymerase eta n=1 Tax=Aplosporella prunicola CBS 121167 TaxID=1176127 RepID=A0A6A6B465_9PEZI|nr:uncharacterized protein K452DRAFT_300598 [Aplosporella prunicola CBS 121167]KAF2139019.1 hypothetical protein K452DRAFT_300598 [Aplosporella prunicola CBS 121167]
MSMSSSTGFQSSASTTGAGGRRKKSAFTFKHLAQLGASAPGSPLRVIAHIDLDAFYAQCEMVRLGVPTDRPLAVQQWQGLIAINYPARAFGLNRHITSTEALKLCPDLILQHVATWKEGDENWAYHEDAFKNMATHKVSLDPYRLESRKILAVIKESLPKEFQKVEKASIDEVFIDLSAQIHAVMLERYPELQGPPPYDDLSENLPPPPTTALDWQTDHLIDLDPSETEDDDPDWDDIAILVGSEIVRDVRAKIYEVLKYTCSGGISRNKMLAKLGSGYKKPNQQTIIRNRAVQHFLSDIKFTKIRNLGGKLGDEIVTMFNTELVKELLEAPLEQLQKLGDDVGLWLYSIIRGEDHSEINPRTQIKSMLSAKSFRPPINTLDQAVRWLRIFAADIFSRCVEEGVLEHKRRPKTINLHHRNGAQTRSKSAQIPQGKTLSEVILFDLAKTLLAQVVADGRAWPCSNLSLSVGGFEEGITGNKGIGGFLVRGEEAKALISSDREVPVIKHDNVQTGNKRRKLDNGGIQRFFGARQTSRGESESDQAHYMSRSSSRGDADQPETDTHPEAPSRDETVPQADHEDYTDPTEDIPSDIPPPSAQPQTPSHHAQVRVPATEQTHRQQTLDTYFCERCNAQLPVPEKGEHADWHFAKDLAKELREQERANSSSAPAASNAPPRTATPKATAKGRGRPPGSATKGPEKGQLKLAFGKG